MKKTIPVLFVLMLIFISVLVTIIFMNQKNSQPLFIQNQEDLYKGTKSELVNSIDLFELIKLFCIDAERNQIYTANDWRVGSSQEHEEIIWTSDGVELNQQETYPPLFRRGKAIVSVNNLYYKTLSNNLEPAYWYLELRGARVGFFDFKIRSPQMNDFEELNDFGTLLSKMNLQFKKLSKFGYASEGGEAFEVQFKGKQPVWIIHMWSSGSGGTSFFIETYFGFDFFMEKLQTESSLYSL